MLCSRFLRPPAARAARPVLRGHRARLRRACSRAYERSLRWVLRHRPATMRGVAASLLVATARALRPHPEGLHPRPRISDSLFAIVEAAQGVSFDADGEVPAGGDRHHPRRSRRRGASSRRVVGVERRHRQHAQPGPHLHPPRSPAASAPSAQEIIERLRPAADRGARASASSCRSRRRSASAASSPRASTSSRCRARTRDELYDAAPRFEARAARSCPALQDVTSDLQIKNPQVNGRDRSRPGGDARRHRRADRERALRRLRHPLDLDDLRAEQPVQGDPRARGPSIQLDPTALSQLYVRVDRRAARAARRGGDARRRASAR